MRGRCIVQGLKDTAVEPYARDSVCVDGFEFDGFNDSAATPLPNQVFDVLLPMLGESELKVLLYIARQTLGCDRSEAPISLDPFPGGTTTSNGHMEKARRILGRGLLTEGLRSLLQKGLVHARKGPPGVDGNPIIMYSLRFKTHSLGSGPRTPAVGPSAPEPLRSYPMKSRRRATGGAELADWEEDIASVVGPLVEFGLSCQAAQQLADKFPGPHILEKLSQVRAMVEAGSPLVSRNPQGYLRRAIEEDYTSPQRFGAAGVEAGQRAKAPGTERDEGHRPITRRASAKASAQELNRVWQGALGFLRSHVSRANFQVWLEETALLDLDEGQALVGSPTAYQRDWLEGRMGSLVRRALAEVLGRDVEVAFATFDSSGGAHEKS